MIISQNAGHVKAGISLIHSHARPVLCEDETEEEEAQLPRSHQQQIQYASSSYSRSNPGPTHGEDNFSRLSPSTFLPLSAYDDTLDITISEGRLLSAHLRAFTQYEEYHGSELDEERDLSSDPGDQEPEERFGSHTHSKTWSSYERRIMDKWNKIQPKLMRMYPTERSSDKVCPFVPRDASEWCQHVTEINAAEKAALERKMLLYEESRRLGFPDLYMLAPFKGKKFGTMGEGEDKPAEPDECGKKVTFKYSKNPPTRGYVLSERTIWCPFPSVPWRQQPAWPCKAEMDWEGDQRVATENGRFGRFPPLPRVDPNNDAVAWHLNPRLRPYPFDDPWIVPTMEDIYLPVDQIEDAGVISSLLNQSLIDELDNPPIPVRDPNPHSHYYASTGSGVNRRLLSLPTTQTSLPRDISNQHFLTTKIHQRSSHTPEDLQSRRAR